LAAEMFVDEARVKARHIPYKGVGPMVTDLLGGQIDFAVLALPSVQQHIKSGALKAVGMCGDKRSVAAPDVPTFVEQGLPTYVIDAWFGVLGPKGMAPTEVQRIRDAVAAALTAPETREIMDKQGNVIDVSTVEQAHRHLRAELAKYAAVSKRIGLEAQ
jgi:tripartite-type tricarboxylate transporter receptor subunit TctC